MTSPLAPTARRLAAATLAAALLAAPAAIASAAPAPGPAAPAPGLPSTWTSTSTAASATPGAPARDTPAGGTTWTVEPATAEGPDGRVSHRIDAEPGQSLTDHVAVTNFSTHAATFELYASDGLVTADGQFDLLPAGTAPTDSGAWVALGEGGAPAAAGVAPLRVEVGPESTVTVPFTLTVPADATPGDHPAGIVASLVPAPGEQRVTVDARVGVRLHLRVAGDVVPALTVSDVRATYATSWNPLEAGSTQVTYTVTNTGNVRLGAGITADVAGPFGWGATAGDGATQRELLPGQSVTSTVALAGTWPLGQLSGGVDVVPVVVGDDLVEVAVPAASATWSAWAMPWAQLGVLALAVAAVLALRGARRRREGQTQRRIDAALAARDGA